jgi:hypothetical protein
LRPRRRRVLPGGPCGASGCPAKPFRAAGRPDGRPSPGRAWRGGWFVSDGRDAASGKVTPPVGPRRVRFGQGPAPRSCDYRQHHPPDDLPRAGKRSGLAKAVRLAYLPSYVVNDQPGRGTRLSTGLSGGAAPALPEVAPSLPRPLPPPPPAPARLDRTPFSVRALAGERTPPWLEQSRDFLTRVSMWSTPTPVAPGHLVARATLVPWTSCVTSWLSCWPTAGMPAIAPPSWTLLTNSYGKP